MLLLPIMFYLPQLFSSGEGQSAAAAGAFIGSIAALFIWGFVFAVIALVTGVIGYVFKRRERKKLAVA